ncbi:HlyD family secretion protein [Geoanaerobacter pelophilus]|uniref:HlyD family secretion protein n=1 Tax=Geoanaerobacter pelophilus TaxID=60036 RepID=UPI000A270D5C|nr:efflux RND transporter periplasmic adaptor subunit [Geoanaerobacter pelophilus]
MKKKGIIAALLVAAAVAVFFYLRHGRNGESPTALRISGNIEVTEVQLSFKVPGRVQERLVDEGMQVARGQVVARLEDRELADALKLAQADEAAAAASLAELEAGNRSEEVAQGAALLARAEAESARVAADYQRSKALFAREVIPRQQFDAAKAAYEGAAASVRERREALQLLRKGARRERVQAARAAHEGALARLSTAKERLGYATLAAPVSGVVLSKAIEPGEQVAAGTPVVTLGDLGDCWLKGYIPETELARVKLGQRARVTADGLPGKAFEGRVSFISSQAEFTPKSVQTEKERVKLVYRVKISLANPGMDLKPGMPADAVIDLGEPQAR